jgi:hypothetical protein
MDISIEKLYLEALAKSRSFSLTSFIFGTLAGAASAAIIYYFGDEIVARLFGFVVNSFTGWVASSWRQHP